MIYAHGTSGRCLVLVADPAAEELLRAAKWLDVYEPTEAEMRRLEEILRFQLPTRNEAQEIEISSRLYQEDHATFMTATIMVRTESNAPATTPVTFAFQPGRLVTLRFAEPQPFRTFTTKLEKQHTSYLTSQRLLVGLVDEVIDRIADILELVGSELNRVSNELFYQTPKGTSNKPNYADLLAKIGRNGELAANARESLVTIGRLVAYFVETTRVTPLSEGIDEHWRTISQDITALTDHATFLSSKVNFFLDAAMGRISNEQNSIIKIFSVASVIFLPPTLVASIYGMNFRLMPELEWRGGYTFALILMVISAVVPIMWFRRRGWL